MKTRRVLSFVLVAGLVGLIVLGLAQAASSRGRDDPAVPAACTVATAWKVKGNCGMVAGTNFLGTTDAQPLIVKTNKAERLRVSSGGNVGIGTTSPANRLTVDVGPGGVANSGITIEGDSSPPGDIGLQINNLGPGGSQWYLDSTSNSSGWGGGKLGFISGIGNSPILTVTSDRKVGIGTTTPDADLTVQHYFGGYTAFDVLNSSGTTAFWVGGDGNTQVTGLLEVNGHPQTRTTEHVCWLATVYLTFCNSAAEYVPTANTGSGSPRAGDLVSIAPRLANPYRDHHSPFVVGKSARACDPSLLGFLLNPKSGADGKKLNSHYLPLGIYGYFPAKVTMQGGTIHRGDPITSSSTPGYGMKATGACKTIGYALQDATTSGTIQVFAAQGETTAPAVTKLQAQVRELKRQNASLSARIAAIEQTLRVSARTTARTGGHAG
jgi:hypothetical protein